jgi:hypothetical protein
MVYSRTLLRGGPSIRVRPARPRGICSPVFGSARTLLPNGEKRAPRHPTRHLGAIVDRFLAWKQPRLRPSSYGATRRYLKEIWKPLHALHLTNISRADVAARLGAVAEEHGPIAADRARAAYLHSSHGRSARGLCEVNPVIGTNKARARALRRRAESHLAGFAG